MSSNRELWYADVLRAGLATSILAEPDILNHATPAVLIASLPKDVLVRLLDATLTSGAMSPHAVVATASPEILAVNVPSHITWGCIAAAAERAGILGDGPPEEDGAREFLRRALEQALVHNVATPRDVVDHVDASVISHHFPDALTTKLLEASLAAGKMNPQLIVDTLGVESIAKYAPTRVVWACLAKTGAALGKDAADRKPSRALRTPSLEFLDDDMPSVLVDLEDSAGMAEVVNSVMPEKPPEKVEAAPAPAPAPSPLPGMPPAPPPHNSRAGKRG